MNAPVDPKAYFAGREQNRLNFLRQHIAGDFTLHPIGEDWAARRHLRVNQDGKGETFVLLESIPDHMPKVTMGHRLADFIKIAKLLHSHGIHAPDIYGADEHEGFVLIEDFGDISITKAMERGDDPHALYTAATDVLIAMRDNITLDDLCDFPKYKDSFIRKGMQRVVDWYVPATRGAKNNDDLLPTYLAAWADVVAKLPPPPIGFLHGDFHLGNLMLLPDGTCGVLDFQDAMAGPQPYDLGNLLENIRRDVPSDIYNAMMARYGGDETTRAWFRVMATQFHCRIIGQVIRLAVLSGKTDLLAYMPRIQNYLREGLKDPVLRPLADWFAVEKVDLAAQHCFDPEIVKNFIRSNAF